VSYITIHKHSSGTVIPGSTGSSRRSTRPEDTAFCWHQSPCGAFGQAVYRR